MVLPGAGRGAGPVQPGQHRPVGAGSPVLVRGFGGNRTTALLLLVFTLLLWGVTPWRWSGFLSANSFGFGLPYPSAFATAAAWACIGQWTAYLDGGPRRSLAVATGLGALAVLTHPFTGAWLAIALACVLAAQRSWTRARTLSILAAAGAGAVTVLAWPYYDVLGLGWVVGIHRRPPAAVRERPRAAGAADKSRCRPCSLVSSAVGVTRLRSCSSRRVPSTHGAGCPRHGAWAGCCPCSSSPGIWPSRLRSPAGAVVRR